VFIFILAFESLGHAQLAPDEISEKILELKAQYGDVEENYTEEVRELFRALEDPPTLAPEYYMASAQMKSDKDESSTDESYWTGTSLSSMDTGLRSFPAIYGCIDSSGSVCRHVAVRRIFKGFLDVYPGSTYEIETSDLKAAPGESNSPDTVLRLLDPNTGKLLAVDDDGGPGPLASRIIYVAQRNTTLNFLVHGFGGDSHGTCDITVKEDGVTILFLDDRPFGGYPIWTRSVKAGDQIFVGKNTNASDVALNPSVYSDSVLYLFQHDWRDCDFNCGRYAYNDDDIGTLSRIHFVPWNATATILIGSYSIGGIMNARVFHVKKSGWGAVQCPSTAAHADCDGDGLSREVEAAIGTCDAVNGPSSNCSYTTGKRFRARASFNPSDSDSDGPSDYHEVYGIQMSCSKTPQPPRYDPGTCSDATLDETCPYCHKLALSTMDSPDPTIYDIFVHWDSVSDSSGSVSGIPHTHSPSNLTLEYLDYTFSREPQECRTSTDLIDSGACPADTALKYDSKIHIFKGTPYTIEMVPHGLPSSNFYATFFNRIFTARRKHSRFFRWVFSPHFYGVSFNHYAVSVVQSWSPWYDSTTTSYRTAVIAAHELGHSLGLSGDVYWPNYLSLMSYSYQSANAMAKKSSWPSDLNSYCFGHSNCSSGTCGSLCYSSAFDCSPDYPCVNNRCTNWLVGLCSMNCGLPMVEGEYYGRFSRGGQAPIDEYAIIETGHTQAFAMNWWCAQGQYTNYPSCPGCDVDIDGDGIIQNGTSVDLNNDGYLTTFTDRNDWRRIFNYGKTHDVLMPKHYYDWFLAFASSVSSSGVPDASGFYTAVQGTYRIGAGVPWGYTEASHAVYFDGPGSGHYVKIPASKQIEATGQSVGGVPYSGFAVNFAFKLESSSLSSQPLIRSNYYNIDALSTSQGYRLRAWITGHPDVASGNSFNIQLNKWYRVVFVLSSMGRLALIIQESQDSPLFVWGPPQILGWQDLTGINQDPGDVYLGANPQMTISMDGAIDDIEIWAGPICIHRVGYFEAGGHSICSW